MPSPIVVQVKELESLNPVLATWLRELTEAELREELGGETVHRGRAYVNQGRIVELTVGGDGESLRALVRGSRGMYTTVIEAASFGYEQLQLDDLAWFGRCSCPMVSDCKHVAAVLISASQTVLRAGPAAHNRAGDGWEKQLAALVREPELFETSRLGLQFEYHEPRPSAWSSGAPSVRMRPVTTGKRGGWIKTGVGWNDLMSPYQRVHTQPEQLEAVRELYSLAESRLRAHYSYGSQSHVRLDDVGPGVWRVLARAVQAGVTLVPAPGLAGVTLSDAAAEVTLAAAELDEGGIVLDPQVVLGSEVVALRDLSWVGRPPFGFAQLQQLAHDLARAGASRQRLNLVPLARPLDDEVAAVLATGPVRVPERDVARFATTYLPRLRRRVPVRGGGQALRPPTITGPELVMELLVQPEHHLGLVMSWRYVVNGSGVELPADLPGAQFADGVPERDLAAEAAVTERVRAAGLPPHLLSGPAPEGRPRAGAVLEGIEAARFVTEVLPELGSLDDVIVAVEGELPEYREVLDAPLITVSATDDADPTRTDWFDLGVTVTVGGENVPFGPLFKALARGAGHLVLTSGAWFSLDRPELHALRALIDEARTLQDRRGALQLNRVHAGLWEELVNLGVVGEQSSRWSQSVATLLALDEFPTPPTPSTLKAQLRPYQERGYQWLSLLWEHGLGGILADDMGLGKTVQTLAAIARQSELGTLTEPVLVVCPTSVIGTWAEQAAQFSPDLRVAMVTGTGRRREHTLAALAASHDIVVTSYTLVRLDAEEYGEIAWAAMILDEAQAVKNHRAKTYASVRKMPARFKVAITGTPLENSLMDLWSLLSIVAPGLYPDPQAFTDNYRRPIEVGASVEHLERLRRRIRPFMLRRRKADVAPELPPKQEQILHVDLSPAQRRVYGKHLQLERQRVLGMLDDVQRNRVAIFRALTKLRQLTLAPELVDPAESRIGSSKLDVLMEQLEEVVAEGHRALVFSQFTGFLGLLRRRLDTAGIAYSYLDGRTRDRAQRIASFREGDDPLFLISLKAGGFGLTLTEADYVYVLDPWWNPAAEEQAIDRTHRIGQDKTVMVYRLVAADTIEDKVVALQERKRQLFDNVIEAGSGTGAPLSADDIRELLA